MTQKIQDAIGFRKVLDLLASSKKPICGHNMYLDLGYTLHHFFHELPPNFKDFKTMVHQYFPVVYDTKYIGTHFPELQSHLQNTVLGTMYSRLKCEPFNDPIISSLSLT